MTVVNNMAVFATSNWSSTFLCVWSLMSIMACMKICLFTNICTWWRSCVASFTAFCQIVFKVCCTTFVTFCDAHQQRNNHITTLMSFKNRYHLNIIFSILTMPESETRSYWELWFSTNSTKLVGTTMWHSFTLCSVMNRFRNLISRAVIHHLLEVLEIRWPKRYSRYNG